jgi:hypothetical protein
MATRKKTAAKPRATKKAKAEADIDAAEGAQEATPAKKEATTAKVSEAKGRPMLQWVGKQPLESVQSFPAQLIETFTPPLQP